jgi:spoIIIJ-associated protein
MENKKDKTAAMAKEYEGNTVEDAIKKALDELKLPKEKIKIKILTEGQRGLFGMEGAKKAKIRVTVLFNESKKN